MVCFVAGLSLCVRRLNRTLQRSVLKIRFTGIRISYIAHTSTSTQVHVKTHELIFLQLLLIFKLQISEDGCSFK